MKNYIGTKTINAKPMNRGEYNEFRGWEVPENKNPADEGYLVEYTDGGKPNVEGYAGYVSWSPKEQFENAYRETSGLNFGLAYEAMRQGKMVARKGWNGKGMFIYRVPANVYKAQTESARNTFGEDVPYGAYVAMKTAQGNVVPWLCSMTDMETDDWQIVETCQVAKAA